MLKKLAAGFLIFLAVAATGFAQQDKDKAALIEEMMQIVHPERAMAQALAQFKQAFSRGMEQSFRAQLSKQNADASKYEPDLHKFEDRMFDLVADRMSWDKIKPKYTAIYDETFTKQELIDIVAFYKTPSGKSLLEKMPSLMAKGAQVGQAQMGDATEEIQKMTQDFMHDIDARVKQEQGK